MPELSKDVVALLQYLAPGFLVAWAYFCFTSHVKPSQFERVVQALIYTVVVQALVAAERVIAEYIGVKCCSLGEWTAESTLIASLITALGLGMILSVVTNTDSAHRLARKLKMSSRSGHPGEWYGAFCDFRCHIVLNLKDGEWIYGWPLRWPSDSSNGHFLLDQVSRGVDDVTQELPQLYGVLIAAKDVVSIEFVRPSPELNNEQTADTISSAEAWGLPTSR